MRRWLTDNFANLSFILWLAEARNLKAIFSFTLHYSYSICLRSVEKLNLTLSISKDIERTICSTFRNRLRSPESKRVSMVSMRVSLYPPHVSRPLQVNGISSSLTYFVIDYLLIYFRGHYNKKTKINKDMVTEWHNLKTCYLCFILQSLTQNCPVRETTFILKLQVVCPNFQMALLDRSVK